MSINIPEFVKKYAELVKEPGDKNEDVVSVAGRIHNIRQAGAKLRFYDLWSAGQRCQIMAQAE